MAQIGSSREELANLRKQLFKFAMKSNWHEVKKIYSEHAEVRNARITRSGDTALHIAVSDGQEEVVKDLVELIPEEKYLAVQNDEGNTPLHLAAAFGNVRMCTCIATRDPELIGIRNEEKETPFFVAALNGKKEAFLCLHTLCGSTKGYDYCRRSDGNSILHCAINGEYFDLAFQIIHLYKDLVNFVNEEGLSPLHVLANKPSAFSSGTNLGWLDNIIYAGTFVGELKIQEDTEVIAAYHQCQIKCQEGQGKANYPENCQTCVNLLGLFRHAYRTLCDHRKEKSERDAESHSQTYKDHQRFPRIYDVCLDTVKFVSKALIIMLGFGYTNIREIQAKKERNIWSMQIVNKLLESSMAYEYDSNGQEPEEKETSWFSSFSDPASFFSNLQDKSVQKDDKNQTTGGKDKKDKKDDKKDKKGKNETPILLAAKNGITEMVENILNFFPVAIHDTNSEEKNAVLLAVEYRQPHVYQLLDKREILQDSLFRKVDKDGNSALHLAAKFGQHSPWLIPGAALQMQWEMKWFEFVRDSMPPHFFPRYNNENKTANEVFSATHKDLVKTGGKWLTSTSESCSVVAALIATVAFATASTVPGGVNQESGAPTLENYAAFDIFALSSLVALCFSITALVMFLAILTSRHQERDFHSNLPRKLLVGLTTLFISIASMLISFCAGHFFVLKDKLKYAAFPIYAITCLPVTFFALAQFPLYIDLILAAATNVPRRSFKVINP
ncbi:hypothetical protein NMG60_11034795 [Bertholletia excelsa]